MDNAKKRAKKNLVKTLFLERHSANSEVMKIKREINVLATRQAMLKRKRVEIDVLMNILQDGIEEKDNTDHIGGYQPIDDGIGEPKDPPREP